MKIIAVVNQKGGVAKTTTSVNLSACLADRGVRVLLIDFDPQGNASSALGHRAVEGQSLYRVLIGKDSILTKIQPTRLPGLSLIPAQTELAGAEVDLVRSDNHLSRLRDVLAPLRDSGRFDFVIIDCPPSLGILMTSALAAADGLLIPIQCEYFGLEGLARIIDVHDQIVASGINTDVTIEGILMTMYDGRTGHSRAVVDEVRRAFESVVYQTMIPRSIVVAESQSFEKTLLEYEPSSKVTLAYRALADEFITRQLPTTAPVDAAATPATSTDAAPPATATAEPVTAAPVAVAPAI
jgi:chromosome partitioning protein